MQEITTSDLLLSKQFWILGVTAGILANVLVMLLWKSRHIVMLGVQLGKARRKGYLKAREDFANKMASRENIDILSFLVLNYFANSAVAAVALLSATFFMGIAFYSNGNTLLILAPISIVYFLWMLMFTVGSMQKYYMAQYAMARVLRKALRFFDPKGDESEFSSDSSATTEDGAQETETQSQS